MSSRKAGTWFSPAVHGYATMSDHHNEVSRPSMTRRLLARGLFASDHQTLGLRYLWLALCTVFLGMAMSLAMRIHLVWPAVHLPLLSGLSASPERYAALATLHGSLMVFFVLTAAPQAGFGNYFLPTQIGAREMAFPSLTRLAFWITVLALVGMTSAFLLPQQTGITLWIASVAAFCLASLLSAVNFAVTAIDLRATGMTLPRLPLTVWAWFLNAILGLLIFSILLAACACLLCDRLLGTHFFAPASLAAAAQSLSWQNLFWFFAQAEIYIAILPCFGLVTHLVATFSRKPVWMERGVVLALCAVGLFGFCIWGQHMFASGMNPYSPLVFSLLASSLGLPASFLLISWLGTLWNARVQLNTSMLFTLGFISLFLSGGLSGLFLARRDLAAVPLSNDVITGHFHLVMGVAATFAILAALFFWFPKLFGRRLNESLGQLHFWLTFAGVYAVFMPMHWLGLLSHSRAASAGLSIVTGSALPNFITVATLLTISAQIVFLYNFLWSLLRGERTEQDNPWRVATLEWSKLSLPTDDFAITELIIYRGAYECDQPDSAQEFLPQHVAAPPSSRQSAFEQ